MFNFFAIFTIVRFRIREFTSDYHYSILAPLTSNLLFVIIFSTIGMTLIQGMAVVEAQKFMQSCSVAMATMKFWAVCFIMSG